MSRYRSLLAGMGIVGFGLVAAVPFARQALPSRGTMPPVEIEAPLHEVPLNLPAQSAPSPAVGLRDTDPSTVRPPLVATNAPATQSRLEDSGAPPALPEMYQPLLESPSPASRPTIPARPASTAPRDVPPLRIPAAATEDAEVELVRTHRIVDGDTLGKIAQRYWQDTSLADELFAANRAVLKSPDPLPLGVVLQIPARSKALKPPAPAATPPSVELSPPVRQPKDDETRMVPFQPR